MTGDIYVLSFDFVSSRILKQKRKPSVSSSGEVKTGDSIEEIKVVESYLKLSKSV